MSDSGSSLIGESKGDTILTTTSNINMCFVGESGANTDDFYVSDLTLNGSNAGTGAGLYLRNVWYSKFERLKIEYNYNGIYLDGESVALAGGHVVLEDISCGYNLYAGVYHTRHYSSIFRHVTAHNNAYGIMETGNAQGVEMYGCFTSFNTYTGLWIQGSTTGFVQGFQASSSDAYPQDYGIRIRDASAHWVFDEAYVEYSSFNNLFIESGVHPTIPDNITDIEFSNSYFVKANRTGVIIDTNNGHNVTQVRFVNCVFNNNGLETDDTYYGCHITDDNTANSTTHFIYFTQCWFGNDNDWFVNNYQRGLFSDMHSDYVHTVLVDTYSAKTVGIVLGGSNNHVAHSWNLTTWLGIWNGTDWLP